MIKEKEIEERIKQILNIRKSEKLIFKEIYKDVKEVNNKVAMFKTIDKYGAIIVYYVFNYRDSFGTLKVKAYACGTDFDKIIYV